ncbi:MAG: ribulose-phosphate 3-epimerase [Oscillospiraceae bacterium]|nr:ribulose-phosphate 3-epimerase [Oscillospiraceae bacterium]
MNNIASASILSADFCNLGRDIARAEEAGCKYIHFDVMDGVFVPNISYGIPILKSVSKIVKGVLDVHLMIIDPIKYVKDFADNGADIITFHSESKSEIIETINAIHNCGKKAGLAIKPNTPVSEIEQYLDKIDMLLVMTVEPGFGGQGFIYETLDKISEAKKIIDSRGLSVPIQVDGGINEETAELVKKSGAEILVAGSYLFGNKDMKNAVEKLVK